MNNITGSVSIEIDVRFLSGGAWSGIDGFIDRIYQELIDVRGDDIRKRFSYELHFVLRKRREEIPIMYASLTDTSEGAEKTRNFATDRAYRIVNGLVDLVLEWKDEFKNCSILRIQARFADLAGHLATRFLAELHRRGVSKGVYVTTLSAAESGTPLTIPIEKARAIADMPGYLYDITLIEEYFPALLALGAVEHDRYIISSVALRVICLYNHFGYYHDGMSLLSYALAGLDELGPQAEEMRWNYVGNIFQGLAMTGRGGEAIEILRRYAEPYLSRPDLIAKMNYLFAMSHLRYLDEKSSDLAEKHLNSALKFIVQAEPSLTPSQYAFETVFIKNGLAFLRVRQGRLQEAISLCRAGTTVLDKQIEMNEHKLHRSVLNYNIAQVLSASGDLDNALLYYEKSIALDPFYPEYFNESGNILLMLGRHEAALDRYLSAIRYSAPFPEVYHNIGICYANLSDFPNAVKSFTRSLELDPNQMSVISMRAEAEGEMLDYSSQICDLTTVIANDPGCLPALLNRAVAYYQIKEYSLSLEDIEAAAQAGADSEDIEARRRLVSLRLAEADSSDRH